MQLCKATTVHAHLNRWMYESMDMRACASRAKEEECRNAERPAFDSPAEVGQLFCGRFSHSRPRTSYFDLRCLFGTFCRTTRVSYQTSNQCLKLLLGRGKKKSCADVYDRACFSGKLVGTV